jgi:hypothetical protein
MSTEISEKMLPPSSGLRNNPNKKPCLLTASSWAYFLTLKMEATCFSETSVDFTRLNGIYHRR